MTHVRWKDGGGGRSGISNEHPVFQRAYDQPLANIGQLSDSEKHALRDAVNRGVLEKSKGGPFPTPKDVYHRPGYNVAEARRLEFARMQLYRQSRTMAAKTSVSPKMAVNPLASLTLRPMRKAHPLYYHR